MTGDQKDELANELHPNFITKFGILTHSESNVIHDSLYICVYLMPEKKVENKVTEAKQNFVSL